MVTQKRAKSKRKPGYRKRSAAAKKGWETRRKNAFIAHEVDRLREELTRVKDMLKSAQSVTMTERKRTKALEKELARIKESASSAAPPFPLKRKKRGKQSRKKAIQDHLERAKRIYGKGPGFYDTVMELADYYDVDVDEVYEIYDLMPH